MSRFASIRTRVEPTPSDTVDEHESAAVQRAAARVGLKAVSGYFSPDVSRALRSLALERETSLLALMGEAFDDLLRKYGKHPFGER